VRSSASQPISSAHLRSLRSSASQPISSAHLLSLRSSASQPISSAHLWSLRSSASQPISSAHLRSLKSSASQPIVYLPTFPPSLPLGSITSDTHTDRQNARSHNLYLVNSSLLSSPLSSSITLSLQTQNLPFQQILPTLDFFYLAFMIMGLDRTYHALQFHILIFCLFRVVD